MAYGSIVLAALGIGLLIFVHELGHFLAARLAGVRVEVFSLGFGPRLFGGTWKGTDFRVSLVPFGGYVMVAGQDPADRRYPAEQCLWSKSIGQRALFWSGGVLMNALFALMVFPLVFRAGVAFVAPVVGGVAIGSPAWEVGIQAGDRIRSVGGKPMYSWENLTVEIALAGPRPVEIAFERPGEGERRVLVVPRHNRQAGFADIGILHSADPAPALLTVAANGPAARAGVRDGDRLLAVDGVAATGASRGDALGDLLDGKATPRLLRVERDGQPQEFRVVPEPVTEQQPLRIGVSPLARRVVAIRAADPLAARLGLQRGDVLLAIDGTPFVANDLAAIANGPAPELALTVARDGKELLLRQAAAPAERAALAAAVALGQDESLMLTPAEHSPAEAAGLQAGDVAIAVDGQAVKEWRDLQEAVQRAGEQTLTLQVRRVTGATAMLQITPRRAEVFDPGLTPRLAELREEVKAGSFGEAVKLGTVCSLDLVKQLYVTMKRMITGEVAASNLGGIIRISEVSYDAAKRSQSWFWYFLALLSVNLGFVNLLPVPVLDGGHLLFLLIEKVKGSPVSARVFGYSQVVGLVFVLLLVLFVTYNDILRLL